MNIGPVDYQAFTVPAGYHCVKCKASDVRLWRDYQTCADLCELLCFHCAVERAGKTGDSTGDFTPNSSSIGWVVAAVPTAEGDTFWGYSSVPSDACAWWYSLTPDRESPPWSKEQVLTMRCQRLTKDVKDWTSIHESDMRLMNRWIDRAKDMEHRLRETGARVEDWRPRPRQ